MTEASNANFKVTLVALSAGNIPLSITTSLGNILILVALRKECSLHPPSRFLFRCLALSDLFVGLISQPVFVVYLLSLLKSRWKLACFLEAFEHVVGVVLIGLSLCILTAITIDRLLALLLRLRYRTVVTVTRVRKLIVLVLVLAIAVASTSLWKEKLSFALIFVFVFLSGIISTFCYSKMFVTLKRQCRIQDELHPQTNQEMNSPLNIRRFRKTVTSVLWIHCALILCFFPFAVNKAVNSIVKNTEFVSFACRTVDYNVGLLQFISQPNYLLLANPQNKKSCNGDFEECF